MSPSLEKPWFPVETYRGVAILRRGRTYRVGDVRVKTIREAMGLIDHQHDHVRARINAMVGDPDLVASAIQRMRDNVTGRGLPKTIK